MGAAEVIAFEEVRASKQWHTLRQRLHARFDQWLAVAASSADNGHRWRRCADASRETCYERSFIHSEVFYGQMDARNFHSAASEC